MFVRDNIKFNHSENLCIFVEGEFESIFIESWINGHTSSVGEIYRIPNSTVSSYIQIYEIILNMIQRKKHQVMIGTD